MTWLLEVPLAAILFVVLFFASLAAYVRERTPITLAVLLVFAAVSPVFVARLLTTLFDLRLPAPFLAVTTLALLTQPLVTLWLASLVERVPGWLLRLALAALLLTAPPTALLLASPPLALIVAAVAVYCATALAAARYFLRAANKRIGSARLRLVIASGATVVMTATVIVLAASVALPDGNEIVSVGARYGALFAALGYALAFLTPGWLRRQWGARTAYELSRRLLSGSAASDAPRTWRHYLDLVTAAAGVRHGAVVAGERGGEGLTLAAVGELSDARRGWTSDEFRELVARSSSTHQQTARTLGNLAARLAGDEERYVSLVQFPSPDGQTAVLVLAGERYSLFRRDDVELFQTLGLEAAVLADRARASAEQLALSDRLRATVEALRAAHQAKSDFLASMSHELRTPLNAILGFSDLMRSEPESDGRRLVPKDWIEHINVAGRHLLDLINDVLDLAKVEAGRLDLRREPVRVESAVAEAIAGLRPLIDQKRLSVSSDVELPPIMFDRGRLRQVLYNLLSNAIKYTPAGGSVAVSARLNGGQAHIAVRDTGVGIASEHQSRIFDEFTQVGDSQSRQGGTGLGLALTRRLVEAHGGRIELESVPGEGSTFTVIVPSDGDPATEGRAPATRAPAVGAELAEEDSAAPVVLAIEDDPQAVVLLRSYLQPSNYLLVARSDGEAGLRAARELRPAAILLDVLLPGVDGWEVLRELKADPQLRDTPVLILTVVDEAEVGLALGAVDYLVKPIERTVLLSALARHVPTRRNGHRPRVLAVDDDQAARSIITATLKDLDCDVVLAGGGRQALEAAHAQEIDFVICDLVMPELDGFEVVARLKSDPATRNVPILILTGQALSESDKARLNGRIVGICEKGADVATNLRDWLSRVTAAPPAQVHG